MRIRFKFSSENKRRQVIVEGQVVPEPDRCVQCGVCSYYCPIGIDVRRHAWLGVAVVDSHCLTCGECVKRCPRAVLHFEKTAVFAATTDAIKHLNIREDQEVEAHA